MDIIKYDKDMEIIEKYWDQSNKIKQYSFPKKKGLLHGLVQWWHSNGSREIIGTTKKDLRTGIAIFFKYKNHRYE